MSTSTRQRARAATWTAALAAILLAAAPARAGGDRALREAQAHRDQLRGFLDQRGITHRERPLAGGGTRLVFNPHGEQVLAFNHEMRDGQLVAGYPHPLVPVIQIAHMGRPADYHTLVIYKGMFVNFAMGRQSGIWQLARWGQEEGSAEYDRFRPSGHRLYSALIRLPLEQDQKLQRALVNAWTAQQQHGVNTPAAFQAMVTEIKKEFPNWQPGNCTSSWSGLPVGDNGAPLHAHCGLRQLYQDARGFQRDLEIAGNDNVFGWAVYGAEVPSIAANPNANTFFAP